MKLGSSTLGQRIDEDPSRVKKFLHLSQTFDPFGMLAPHLLGSPAISVGIVGGGARFNFANRFLPPSVS